MTVGTPQSLQMFIHNKMEEEIESKKYLLLEVHVFMLSQHQTAEKNGHQRMNIKGLI